ncbi:MAG: methylaspartate mutase [Micromonosporaceae bacterium]|nr:methylaspartate mutase [Micromonosporaceae bacterium]
MDHPATAVRVDLGSTRSFGGFIARAHQAGTLVVQPRMGMSSPRTMRAGLLATRRADATTVGTITLDSYTRMGEHVDARAAVAAGIELNGYPIVAHDLATTRAVLAGVAGPDFPVQVRHGSPGPERIFEALIEAGLHATEGGPVSYCLPYSRAPLADSVRSWARCCELLAGLRQTGVEPHLESFGGCMMGQLCPPSLLVAISVLECLFFRQHGLRSVSLSYAQQTNPDQDREAVRALRRLAAERMPDVESHVVIYAYMGMYPQVADGAAQLLADAAALTVQTGAARLIVKTVAEAHRIPSIADNVAALETAAAVAVEPRPVAAGEVPDTGIYQQARALVDAVVELRADLGQALVDAFRLGYLDIPYCLHPDNAGRTRSYLDGTGRLHWSRTGSLPIGGMVRPSGSAELTAAELLASLSYVQRKYDNASRPREPKERHRWPRPSPPAPPAPTGRQPARASTSPRPSPGQR